MTSNDLVSIMTPVYNAMPYFKDYLDSVINETYRPLELIIIDDGSEDESFDLLESYRTKFENAGIILKAQRVAHGGQARAINYALKLVTGKYLTWCDSDDLLHPKNIEEKVLFLKNNKDFRMVRNNGIVADEDGNFVMFSANARDAVSDTVFEDLLMDNTYCYAGCYLMETALFRECYPDMVVPESFVGQNLQLLLPPLSRTACGFVADTLHTYRRHAGSHSQTLRNYSQTQKRLTEVLELKKKLLDYCECDKEKYVAALEGLQVEYKKRLIEAAVKKARTQLSESRNSDIS